MSRLVWPTVLFAALLFVPKMWFNCADLQWSVFFYNVLGGMTFWFTSALAVTQLLFALLLSVKRIAWAWHLPLVIPFYLLGFWEAKLSQFPWHWKDGLEFTLYFALGGFYFCHEQAIHTLVRRHRSWLLLAYVAIVVVYVLWTGPWTFQVFNLASFPVVVAAIRCLPKPHNVLSFVGRRSLMFYLLCGLTPAAWTTLLRYTCGIHLWSPWVVFLLSLAASWLLTYGIKRTKFLGPLLGIRV